MTPWQQRKFDVNALGPQLAPDGKPVRRTCIKRDWIVIESESGQRWAQRLSTRIEDIIRRIEAE